MTYSKEELAEKFGNVFGASGNYNGSEEDTKRLMDNKELKNYFVDDLGRDESDWTDGNKSSNDLDTVFDKLLTESDAPVAEATEPAQISKRLAKSNAYVKSFDDNVLPYQGNIIKGLDVDPETGKSSNLQKFEDDRAALAEKYLTDAFSLTLGDGFKPKNPDGTDRDSVLAEERAVQGIA